MATTTIVAEERAVAPHEGAHLPGHFLSWGAIIAGAICGAAISLLLFAFGSAIGLTAISPWPHTGLSPVVLAVIGAVWMALVQVVGFGTAGYVAGRVRNSWRSIAEHEQRFRDGMHGFITWALALLIGSAFAVSAAGGLIRGGAQAAAPFAAAGLAARQGPAVVTPADYGVDYLLRPVQGTPATAVPNIGDLRPSLGRIFADNLGANALPPRERSYLVALVSAQTGVAPADAEKRVDEAFAEARSADAKARQAADKARKAAALAAFLAAATLAVGCAAACAAAGMGGRHRDEQTDLRLFGTRRFW